MPNQKKKERKTEDDENLLSFLHFVFDFEDLGFFKHKFQVFHGLFYQVVYI